MNAQQRYARDARDKEFVFAMNATPEAAWAARSKSHPRHILVGLNGKTNEVRRYLPARFWRQLSSKVRRVSTAETRAWSERIVFDRLYGDAA